MPEVEMKTTIKTLYQKGYNEAQIERRLQQHRSRPEDLPRWIVPEIYRNPAIKGPIHYPHSTGSTEKYRIECIYTPLQDYLSKIRKPHPS